MERATKTAAKAEIEDVDTGPGTHFISAHWHHHALGRPERLG